jgi:hypothetical protein
VLHYPSTYFSFQLMKVAFYKRLKDDMHTPFLPVQSNLFSMKDASFIHVIEFFRIHITTWDLKLTTYLHVLLRSVMRGIISPLPNTCSWRGT